MVSVYSIPDFGLFDFCVRDIGFLARLTAHSKGDGARAFRPLESSFPGLNHLGLPEFIKIALIVSKPTMETLIFTHNTVLIYFKSAESRFL